MGKYWPTRKMSNGEPPSRTGSTDSSSSGGNENRRDSSSSASPKRNSFGLPIEKLRRRSSSSGGSGSFYSVRNTVELVNEKGESRLKVCFDSPLDQATWLFDFKKVKDDSENKSKVHSDKTMLIAQQKAEETKKNLQAMTSNSLEERKLAFKNAKAKLNQNQQTI